MTKSLTDPISTPLVVAAAALTKGDRVLVQRRPPGAAMADLWEFPGGKVERGESPELALVRELSEELGIEVGIEDLLPIAFSTERTQDRSLVLLLYRCHRWRGEPHAVHASALAWHSVAGLADLPMPPADVPLVAALRRDA